MATRYNPLHDQMQNVIRGTMWRRVLPIIQADFSYSEVLKLTTPPEVRKTLLEAVRLAEDFGQATITCPIGEAAPSQSVVFRLRQASLKPKRCQLQEDVDPPALKARFDEWLHLRLQLGRDWGRVSHVVKELGHLCPSPAQMRHRFPAIRIIWQAAGDPKLRQLAQTHEVYKPQTRAPFLPYGLTEFGRRCRRDAAPLHHAAAIRGGCFHQRGRQADGADGIGQRRAAHRSHRLQVSRLVISAALTGNRSAGERIALPAGRTFSTHPTLANQQGAMGGLHMTEYKPMQLLFLDFETFYSDDYTLKHMTPVEYILDDRFEAIGCAVKEGYDGKPYWVEGPELPEFFAGLPADQWMISHNMLFDGCIAAWRYNWFPRLYGDTLAMARALLSPHINRFGLERVGVHLGVGAKLGGILPNAKGRCGVDIRSDGSFYLAYVAYALNDNELCARIFRELVTRLPVEELVVVDMVMRCALQPRFVLATGILDQHLDEVQETKRALMARVTTDRVSLMSNIKFAALLRGMGITPPMKISPATGNETYAFAKSDEVMRELAQHPDPQVQALVAARVGIKSTLEETRTQRFLAISRLNWGPHPKFSLQRPWMPVPLRYGAAHTHRFGGEWDLNMQNLGRSSKLRKALQAPPGHKVVRVDASQIEARLTAWLAGETTLLEQFERGEDPYSNFGTDLFGKPVSRETPVERALAKAAVLGCGFGMGWRKFMDQVNAQRIPDMMGGIIRIDDRQAQELVYGYRRTFWRVPAFWQMLNGIAIPCLGGIGNQRMTVGPIVLEPGKATLPSLFGEPGKGLSLTYRDMRWGNDNWTYAWGPDQRKKLYAGKLLENFVQALDRVLVVGAALRLQKSLSPYRLQHQAHDENIYIVPEEYAEVVGERVREEMARRPPWGPDLPLAAEVKIGDAYG